MLAARQGASCLGRISRQRGTLLSRDGIERLCTFCERVPRAESSKAAFERSKRAGALRSLLTQQAIRSFSSSRSHFVKDRTADEDADMDSDAFGAMNYDRTDMKKSFSEVIAALHIGWQTPADLMGLAPSYETDKAALQRSQFYQPTLNIAFEFLSDLLDRQIAAEDVERQQIPRQLLWLTSYVVGAAKSTREDGRPLRPHDQDAFRLVCCMICQAFIKIRAPTWKVRQFIGEVEKHVGRWPLPLWHRIVAEAGKRDKAEVVLLLTDAAYQQWDSRTDEWMLYARAKALSSLPDGRKQLDKYWTVYATGKRVPAVAYRSLPGFIGGDAPLRAPPYLFVFLLGQQLGKYNAKKEQTYLTIVNTLGAMQDAGYSLSRRVWTTLLEAQPFATIRFLERDLMENPGSRRTMDIVSLTNFLLRLIKEQCVGLHARVVFRALRLLGLDIWGQKLANVTLPFHERVPVAGQLQIFADLARMFGRLGHSDRALHYLRLCGDLPYSEEVSHVRQGCLLFAFKAVILSLARAGRQEEAFSLAKQALTGAQGSPVPALSPDGRIIASLLISAARHPLRSRALEMSREILELKRDLKLRTERSIRLALVELFFECFIHNSDDMEKVIDMVNRLDRIGSRPLSQRDTPPGQPVPWRIRSILSGLRREGFIQKMQEASGYNTRKAVQRFQSDDPVRQDQTHGVEWVQKFDSTLSIPGSDDEVEAHFNGAPDDTPGNLDDSLKDSALPTLSSDSSSGSDISSGRAQSLEDSDLEQASTWLRGEQTGISPDADDDHEMDSRQMHQDSTPPEGQEESAEDSQQIWSATQLDEGLGFGSTNSTSTASTDSPEPDNPLLTRTGFRLRIRIEAVLRKDPAAAVSILDEMIGRGLKPTDVHLAPIVEGLCKIGEVSNAREMIRGFQWRLGMTPSSNMVAPILRALREEGRGSEAADEAKYFVQNGVHLDDPLLEILAGKPVPALAQPSELARAKKRAVDSGRPLRVKDVDQAVRFLTKCRRPRAALNLVTTALDTGMRTDIRLRSAVSTIGSNMHKLFRRLNHDGIEIRQFKFEKFVLPALNPKQVDLPRREQVGDLLRALRSYKSIYERCLPTAEQVQDAVDFVAGVEVLVLDLARGVFSTNGESVDKRWDTERDVKRKRQQR